MKHLLILFFLLTTNTFAQGPIGDYAVVKDKDGYVNIRAKESVKRKRLRIVSPLLKKALVLLLLDSYLIKLNTRLLRKTREVMRS